MAKKTNTPFTLTVIEAILKDEQIAYNKDEGPRGTKLAFTAGLSLGVPFRTDLGRVSIEMEQVLTFNVDGSLRAVSMSGKV